MEGTSSCGKGLGRRREGLQVWARSGKLQAMTRAALLLFFVLVSAEATVPGTAASRREIPCKTPSNAELCYWTHGRLGFYNGSPSIRLWKIGTHRVLGIYSGPSADRYGMDGEEPELPTNVKRAFKPMANRIFADFEVCPLEPERQGAMQAACIESAKNIVVEK